MMMHFYKLKMTQVSTVLILNYLNTRFSPLTEFVLCYNLSFIIINTKYLRHRKERGTIITMNHNIKWWTTSHWSLAYLTRTEKQVLGE